MQITPETTNNMLELTARSQGRLATVRELRDAGSFALTLSQDMGDRKSLLYACACTRAMLKLLPDAAEHYICQIKDFVDGKLASVPSTVGLPPGEDRADSEACRPDWEIKHSAEFDLCHLVRSCTPMSGRYFGLINSWREGDPAYQTAIAKDIFYKYEGFGRTG